MILFRPTTQLNQAKNTKTQKHNIFNSVSQHNHIHLHTLPICKPKTQHIQFSLKHNDTMQATTDKHKATYKTATIPLDNF